MYLTSKSSNPPMSQLPTTSETTPNTASYANVTSSTCFPKKDQAIILDSIDGIALREYLIALSSLIPATSIRFISRISNARICIYLDSKRTADNLVEEKKKVIIQKYILEIKPLITRNKRIVLSNVCPVIPNYVIEQKFKELSINVMSPITFMKVGIADPGFSHILSFRRQLYINPDDEVRLPESFQLSFEGTNYWIYISTDALKCFVCNTMGHLAKNCSQILEKPQTPENQAMEETNDSNNTIGDLAINQLSIPLTNENFLEPSQTNLKGKKRIRSPTTSESSKQDLIRISTTEDDNRITELESDDTGSNVSLEDIEGKVKSKKKLKKDSRTEEDVWKDIENNLSELSEGISFPINLVQFISLLDNSRGKQNIKELAYSYTDNILDLIKMCNKLHCKMNKSLKNRCSRLSRKLYEIVNVTPVSDTNKV